MIPLKEPSLLPPEPKVVGTCVWCEGDITTGDIAAGNVRRCDEGRVHLECVPGHICHVLSADQLADLCGYELEVEE